MQARQDVERVVASLERLMFEWSTSGASKARLGDETFRFEGFAGTALVSLDGSGLTVTLPRSDVVVFSSYIEPDGMTQDAWRICRALIRELHSNLAVNRPSA